MARLPKPGGDHGNWGDVLNDYLSQSLKPDGTLKDNAVTSNVLAPNSITNAAIADNAVNAASIGNGTITEALLDGGVQAKLNQAAPGVHASLLNFTPTSLLKWRRALANVRAGSSDAKLLVIGDSTSVGIGGSTSSTVPQNKSWPTFLTSMMNSHLIPTCRGLAIPKSKGTSQTADQRWFGGTGWALNSQISQQWVGFGGFGCFWASATASTSLTYTDGVLADTYDIYYVSLSSNATFTASATGGSSVPVSQLGGSPPVRKVTVTAAAASTSNTVTITHDATTKTLFILGVEPYLSTTRQVRVGNAGASGSSTANWIGYPYDNASNDYGALGSIKAYAPALTIIDLGINDANAHNLDAATYLSNLQQVIAAAQVSGDVIIKTMIPSGPVNVAALERQYVAEIEGLGLPIIDMFARIGSYAAYNAGGYMNDTLHANDFGYADVAGTVFEALRVAG
ncbi:SGNH/GDSL hydrolase family protein [Mycobacterium sp. C31M]